MEKRIMKQRIFSALLIACLLCTHAVFAGGKQEQAASVEEETTVDSAETESEAVPGTVEGKGEAESITVRNCYGKEVIIKKPIERVVLMDASGMPFAVQAIRAENRIVGVPDRMAIMKTLFPVLSSLPSVGEARSPNYEEMFTLDPDLVLATYWTDSGLEEKLEPDIQVLRLNIGPPQTYEEEIEKLGRIFDREKEAKEFIDWCNEKVALVTEEVKNLAEKERPRVFDFYGGEYGASEGPPYGTFGKENFWAGPYRNGRRHEHIR
jgi:ABC-type Fe3+-hydroxamate transport system substrate-binding protein